jgi:ATP-dependent Clp protease ATP-binding subunit ClpC
VLASDESRALGHDHIGTEHLLLGLLREQEGLAARVLAGLGITSDEIRALVLRVVGRGDEPAATSQIPFTPHAKHALELALREALSLGHNYVGTEHLLLGLAHANDGVAMRVLLDFDVDAEVIHGAVLDLLSGSNAATVQRQERNEQEEAQAAAANPLLADQLADVRGERARALAEGDLDRAARARQEEAAMRRSLLGHEEPVGVRSEASIRRVAPWPAQPCRVPAPLARGAAICVVGLAVGLLLGYLFWH